LAFGINPAVGLADGVQRRGGTPVVVPLIFEAAGLD